MRRKFSEKYNIVDIRDTFQLNSMDKGLKNRIWNQIQICYFDNIKLSSGEIHFKSDYDFFVRIYDEFFKSHEKIGLILIKINIEIKDMFFNLEWYEVYDFIEYILGVYHQEEINLLFKTNINNVLESEMSGYRFINNFITPIVDDIEIKEIEDSLNCKHIGVKLHLSNSLEFLSDKESPDYANSIKESISAVESLLNIVSNKENIALNRCLEKMSFEIDKNFKSAMIKLYSWTSSADGIRHGMTGEEIKCSFAEAKYMLVSCSAFINYIIEKQKIEG